MKPLTGMQPHLMPLTPTRNVRVVVSARYLAGDVDEHGWLQRLGWDRSGIALCISLPTLTREGVQDVLVAMGHPLSQLATKVDVVGELFRLSEGDPLLVRLYVEALLPYKERAAILQPEDLPTIEKGLGGYFDRWWEDQKQQWEVQGQDPIKTGEDALNFLNLCATVLGPLSREEVANIAGGNLMSGLKQKTITAQVGRFILGDGKEKRICIQPPAACTVLLGTNDGDGARDLGGTTY